MFVMLHLPSHYDCRYSCSLCPKCYFIISVRPGLSRKLAILCKSFCLPSHLCQSEWCQWVPTAWCGELYLWWGLCDGEWWMYSCWWLWMPGLQLHKARGMAISCCSYHWGRLFSAGLPTFSNHHLNMNVVIVAFILFAVGDCQSLTCSCGYM